MVLKVLLFLAWGIVAAYLCCMGTYQHTRAQVTWGVCCDRVPDTEMKEVIRLAPQHVFDLETQAAAYKGERYPFGQTPRSYQEQRAQQP